MNPRRSSNSYKVHRSCGQLRLRYEPFIPFDQKGGRHTTWVPGVQSTVVPDAPKGILFPGDPGIPAKLTNSDLNNFAPRLGVAWDVSGDAKTVVRGGYGIFYQQINGETTHAAEGPWRGTTQLRQGRIEDPFGSLGQTEPPPESPGRFGCSPISSYPGLACTQYPPPIRIVYTDQNLRTTYTHHVARLAASSHFYSCRRCSYIGKVFRSCGHNFFNAAPFVNSPAPAPPTLQTSRTCTAARLSHGIEIARQLLPIDITAWLRVDGAWLEASPVSVVSLSKRLTDHLKYTRSAHSHPFDIVQWGGRILDRRTSCVTWCGSHAHLECHL